MKAFKRHPYSALVPDMSQAEYDDLQADLLARGQLDDIVLFNGMVLDGWHRYTILTDHGITPRCKTFHGSASEASALVASRLKGRSLTVAQKLDVARKLLGVSADISKSPESIRQTAAVAGVSTATAARERKVREKAAPEVVEAMVAGKVSVNDAHAVAELPPETQIEAVQAVDRGESRTLRVAAGVPDNGHGNGGPITTEERLDAVFATIPEEALPAFRTADLIADLCRQLDKVAGKIADLQTEVGGRLIHVSIVQSLKQARKTLWASRPTHVCPYCAGEGSGCEACHGERWVSATFFDAAPPAKKEHMKKMGAVNVPI